MTYQRKVSAMILRNRMSKFEGNSARSFAIQRTILHPVVIMNDENFP